MWNTIIQWFFITIVLNKVHSADREFFERNVLNSFTKDILHDGLSHPEGIIITNLTVRSVKVANFYKRVAILRDTNDIGTHSYKPVGHIREEYEAERNIMTYFDKVWYLNELADDPKMKTICEFGFDHGHSSLNFLIANPKARIVSLDSYEHDYVSKGR